MWYIVVPLILAIYVFLNVVAPQIFGGLTFYISYSLIWLATTIFTQKICSLKKIKLWYLETSIVEMAIIIAATHLTALFFTGLASSFGRSPYAFTPIAVMINITYFLSALIAKELSRAYLIKSCPKRKVFMGIASIALFYTFISIPLTRFITPKTAAETAKFIGSDLLPTLAQSLLATYLALIGGPTASIAYLGTLEAFEWLCPILPNPPWAIKALITSLIPVIGFLTVNENVSPFKLMQLGIISRSEATGRTRRTKKSSSFSWITIAVIAVILVWSSTGLLGFQPTVIASGSMRPTLDVGDIVITVQTPAKNIKIGDIIQYQTAREPTIHRVIDKDKYEAGGTTWFITQGDANNAPDDPVNERQVTGKVVLIIPKLGWVSIYLKETAANTYTFLTATLPNAIIEGGALILKNVVYITSALAFTAYSYLLLTYREKRRKEEK